MDGDHDVGRLTWDAIARRLDAGAVALLPIGAGAKSHGFHLPMATDEIQARWLAAEIASQLDALVWPVVTYGYYPAFVRYAGSCSLGARTFSSMISEIVTGLLGFGARAVLVLDTGLSTLAPVARALEVVGDPRGHHLRVHDGPRYMAAVEALSEQSHGSHADELETARMLALAPELVDMSRAEASPREDSFDWRLGPLTPDDPASPNFSRSGSFGDPTLASIEKGRQLNAAMREDVIDAARCAVAREAPRA